MDITAIMILKVTFDLPLQPIHFNLSRNHLSDIPLAAPDFTSLNRNDILFVVDIFAAVLLDGLCMDHPGSPVALETELGWVLAGGTDVPKVEDNVVSHHNTLLSGDDILRKFREFEET